MTPAVPTPAVPTTVDTTRGFVYFIWQENLNRVKIGYTSKTPTERVKQLQTANPDRLRVLFTIENRSPWTEGELHEQFAKYRVSGEWFTCSGELRNFILNCLSTNLAERIVTRDGTLSIFEHLTKKELKRLCRVDDTIFELQWQDAIERGWIVEVGRTHKGTIKYGLANPRECGVSTSQLEAQRQLDASLRFPRTAEERC